VNGTTLNKAKTISATSLQNYQIIPFTFATLQTIHVHYLKMNHARYKVLVYKLSWFNQTYHLSIYTSAVTKIPQSKYKILREIEVYHCMKAAPKEQCHRKFESLILWAYFEEVILFERCTCHHLSNGSNLSELKGATNLSFHLLLIYQSHPGLLLLF